MRITAARTFVRAGDEQALAWIDARGSSVATARRWQTRAWLGHRAVMLWRISAEDGSGRSAGATCVGVAVDLPARTDASRWLHQHHEEILNRAERAAQAWQAHAAGVHRAFMSTRLVRERAIEVISVDRVLLDSARSGFQPGLFDRRTEHARLAIVAAEWAEHDQRAARIAALERAQAVSFLSPQLLLVLTP